MQMFAEMSSEDTLSSGKTNALKGARKKTK